MIILMENDLKFVPKILGFNKVKMFYVNSLEHVS